jgi:cell division control protein 7
MMATAVFSQHSSNPLEVGSSDQRNREYRRRVQTEVAACLSEDPEQPFTETELSKYHRHLADMFPNITTLQNQPEPQDNMQALVDLDDDEEMDYGEVIDDMHDGELPPSDKDVDEGIDLDYDTDEEQTIQLRPLHEREEIEKEITELEAAVPQLDEDYRIIDRLGTGTFSSVYKAVDLGYHEKWDNQPWHGTHPPSSSAHYQSKPIPSASKAFVAIKRIYVTSNPERIRNEIAILEDCRSCRHVSQIITAFRHEDQVVVIMPYHRNVDFRVSFSLTLILSTRLTYWVGLLSPTLHGGHSGIHAMHDPCFTRYPCS